MQNISNKAIIVEKIKNKGPPLNKRPYAFFLKKIK